MARKSILEIYGYGANGLTAEQRKSQYKAEGIEYFELDGDRYENYGQFSFTWEKSYVKPPSRGTGFVISNLNSHATGVVGHAYIDFSLMSIDDYRSIMKKDLEKNEFLLSCYDPIYNKRISINVYLATPERAKLKTIANKKRKNDGSFEEWVELVGVEEYTVELIGTNTEINKVSVTYRLNPPTGIGDQTQGEENVGKGTQIIIGGASTFPDRQFEGYVFAGWSIYPKKDPRSGNYIDGTAHTINDDLVLYAQWESTEDRTLTFNYGLSEPMYENGQPVYSRTVQKDQSIRTLPTFDEHPQVTYDGKTYGGNNSPYSNGGWYKANSKSSDKVESGFNYWQNTNSMIYLLYDVEKYTLKLNANMEGISFADQTIEYGGALNLPNLVVNGYEFLGWYLGDKQFSDVTMPPIDLDLIAKWKKVEQI